MLGISFDLGAGYARLAGVVKWSGQFACSRIGFARTEVSMSAFRMLLSLALLAFPAVSFSSVTPLPGASGQSTRLGAGFANSVGVKVLDAQGRPAVNESVSIYTPLQARNIIGGMFPDMLRWHSGAIADAEGNAVMPMPYGLQAGTATLTFDAGPHGAADIQLRVEESLPPAQVVTLRGNRQTAHEGAELESPFTVQVLDGAGTPIPFAIVAYNTLPPSAAVYPETGVSGTFDGITFAVVAADARGIATSPRFTVAMANPASPFPGGPTPSAMPGGQVIASTLWAGIGGSSTPPRSIIRFDVELTSASRLTPQDMWWGGPPENGWGLSVVEHGRGLPWATPELFIVLFIYDAEGKATWYVASAGFWDTGYATTWRSPLYKPKGTPFFAYDARALQAGPVVGELYVRFIGSGRIRLEYDLRDYPANVGRGTKHLIRQDFSGDTPSPRQGLGDMWWGGLAENGWGLSLLEQTGNLFGVWLTYDAAGAPTWFVLPGGTWTSPTTYEGDLYRTRGARWIGVPFDAGAVRIEPAGRLRVDAASSSALRADYDADGHRGTLILQRQPFARHE
jgi:hypothetical protein